MYFRAFAIAFLLCLFQATALNAAATLRNVRNELIRVTRGYIALFPDETLVRLQEMADRNNPTAMGILGVIYINGLETGTIARKKTIVDPDPKKGAALCKRGAENDPTGYS